MLWQGGLLVLDGKLTAGALVGFLLYTIYIAAALGTLVTFFSAYQEAVGLARRGLELLEKLPDTPERARQELDKIAAVFNIKIVLSDPGFPIKMRYGYIDGKSADRAPACVATS